MWQIKDGFDFSRGTYSNEAKAVLQINQVGVGGTEIYLHQS